MDDLLIKDLSDRELFEIIYNYKNYGYSKEVLLYARDELKNRDISLEEKEKLESLAFTKYEEGQNLHRDEYFYIIKLINWFKLYYIVKGCALLTVVFCTLFLKFYLGSFFTDKLYIYLIMAIIYISIEKPLRLKVMYYYENLKIDIYPMIKKNSWLKELVLLISGAFIPFYDIVYLVNFYKLFSDLQNKETTYNKETNGKIN